MGFKDLTLFLPAEYQTKKIGLAIFYTLIILVITICILCRKRTNPTRPPPARRPQEDIRPKICINGKLVLGSERLETLRALGKSCRVYVVFEVRTDDEEREIRDMLAKIETLEKYRILFCETEIGYKALVRQLNPRLHVECDISRAMEMKSYLNSITMITHDQCEGFYQIVDFAGSESLILNILRDIS
ncbi:unnamed protein product [Blepharisma stoltei]|uniref:Uncharacterized protein n=1 Tax=Blepharisma stoltei TaxID=1481888 RepID=A0AAU9J7P9_9CILI|nr:unnamed protein product [Blepharisma stoltei]